MANIDAGFSPRKEFEIIGIGYLYGITKSNILYLATVSQLV